MKTFRVILASGVLVAVAATAGDADAAESQPASRPGRSEQFDALLEKVRTAARPQAVAGAYAEANTHWPRAKVLHEAYLERMLGFGLVDIAAHPARTLVRIDPDHGLGRALLAYLDGRAGRRAEALTASLAVAQTLRRNPGFLNNLGQLVAWYAHATPPPELSAEARRRLDRLPESVRSQPAFVRAADRLAAAYARRGRELDALADKLARAEAAVAEVKAPLADLQTRLAGLADEIRTQRELIDDIEDDIRGAVYYDPYSGYYVYNRYRRSGLRQQLAEERRALQRLRREAHEVQARIAGLRTEFERRQADLDTLRQRRQELDDIVDRAFRWDPPAVEGKITPAVEHPSDVRIEGDEDEAPPQPSRPRAQQQLDIAQLYIKHDMPDKARAILTEVAAQDAVPAAAAEARRLLATLPPAEE